MNYYKKRIYFEATNKIIKSLSEYYPEESKGLKLTKNDNWAFAFDIKIYPLARKTPMPSG